MTPIVPSIGAMKACSIEKGKAAHYCTYPVWIIDCELRVLFKERQLTENIISFRCSMQPEPLIQYQGINIPFRLKILHQRFERIRQIALRRTNALT